MKQLDEERKCANEYKERLIKANNHSKELEKKQLDESEEEYSRVKTVKIKILKN